MTMQDHAGMNYVAARLGGAALGPGRPGPNWGRASEPGPNIVHFRMVPKKSICIFWKYVNIVHAEIDNVVGTPKIIKML